MRLYSAINNTYLKNTFLTNRTWGAIFYISHCILPNCTQYQCCIVEHLTSVLYYATSQSDLEIKEKPIGRRREAPSCWGFPSWGETYKAVSATMKRLFMGLHYKHLSAPEHGNSLPWHFGSHVPSKACLCLWPVASYCCSAGHALPEVPECFPKHKAFQGKASG